MPDPIDFVLSLPFLALLGGGIGQWMARRHRGGDDIWTWRVH